MPDILGWFLLGLIAVILVGAILYRYKNPSAVLDGSTVLHYHMVSAHVNYKHKKDPE